MWLCPKNTKSMANRKIWLLRGAPVIDWRGPSDYETKRTMNTFQSFLLFVFFFLFPFSFLIVLTMNLTGAICNHLAIIVWGCLYKYSRFTRRNVEAPKNEKKQKSLRLLRCDGWMNWIVGWMDGWVGKWPQRSSKWGWRVRYIDFGGCECGRNNNNTIHRGARYFMQMKCGND